MVKHNKINISSVDSALYNRLRLRFDLVLFIPIQNQSYWKVSGESQWECCE